MRSESLGAEVIAISTNNVDSLVPWAREIGISFIAAADFWPHGEVSARYGVLEPHGVPSRATVLVDEAGRVRFAELYPEDEVPPCEPVIDRLRQLRAEVVAQDQSRGAGTERVLRPRAIPYCDGRTVKRSITGLPFSVKGGSPPGKSKLSGSPLSLVQHRHQLSRSVEGCLQLNGNLDIQLGPDPRVADDIARRSIWKGLVDDDPPILGDDGLVHHDHAIPHELI